MEQITTMQVVLNPEITPAGVAQWIECPPENQRVGFPIRAYAWVVGQVPSRGPVSSNHTDVSLSPSLPLSKNK